VSTAESLRVVSCRQTPMRGLSYGHPGMYGIFTIIEAVRSSGPDCGERQVGMQRLPSRTATADGCPPRRRPYSAEGKRCDRRPAARPSRGAAPLISRDRPIEVENILSWEVSCGSR